MGSVGVILILTQQVTIAVGSVGEILILTQQVTISVGSVGVILILTQQVTIAVGSVGDTGTDHTGDKLWGQLGILTTVD